MVSSFSSGSEMTQSLFSSGVTFFGFEEKLEQGSLDTTNKWSEVSTGSGAHTMTNAFIKLATGTTNLSSINESTKRIFQIDNEFVGESGREQFSKFTLNFTAQINTPSNIDESKTLLGMTRTQNSDRSGGVSVGLVVDDGVVKFLTANSGDELTDLSDYIDFDRDYNIKIEYKEEGWICYVNEVQVAVHTTQVPRPRFITYSINNAGTGNNQVTLGLIRAWFEV